MAPKSVTFRRHDHLVSVLFGDLLSHSYNITFSMFLYLVYVHAQWLFCELVMADSVLCITLCTESLTQSKTLCFSYI